MLKKKTFFFRNKSGVVVAELLGLLQVGRAPGEPDGFHGHRDRGRSREEPVEEWAGTPGTTRKFSHVFTIIFFKDMYIYNYV